ncbi:MAG: SGNH/GDSL hydrolase family protein [Lentisphaeria bacterium]|jgi:hypothetical protein
MTNRLSRPWHHLGLLLALLAGSPPARAQAAAAPAPAFAAELVGLPAFVYAADEFNFSLRLANRGAAPLPVAVEYTQGAAPARRFEAEVPPGVGSAPGERLLVVSSQLPAAVDSLPAALVVRPPAGGETLWRELFSFRGLRGDLAGLAWRDDALWTADGHRAVLVLEPEAEASYRRWKPFRDLLKWVGRGRATRSLWAPEWIRDAYRQTAAAGPAPAGLAATATGEAFLKVDGVVPAGGPAILVAAIGSDDAALRTPHHEFARAVDAALDRARLRNPRLELVIVTPPPVPVEEKVTAAYAEILRRLAREHHARLVDLHADWLARADWHRFYAVDGDPALLGRRPNAEGLAAIAAALNRAFAP